MSAHYLVEVRVKKCRGFVKLCWRKRVVQVNELGKEAHVKRYLEKLSKEWTKVRLNEAMGAGEEWEVLKKTLLVFVREECGGGGKVREVSGEKTRLSCQ